ncbi:hypothetical protein AAFF_G00085500 [Aldrovandia affinis]|uniref:Uncharacterized protein n=1 Tax=Aldrovandia affinis TaxID=143900 RepID=A0AAD7RWR1_9TELE|nr:hypothetical protein AAFF_G00085500 [Aldrovandia affinis]
MSNPEYIVFTDSELEHVRRSYFEQKRLGTEHSVALSKELLCRLIRNTMTNMISIARATEDSRYPSKHEVNAMAKRLVEYYPMIKDRSSSSNTEWVLDELRRIIQPTNSQYISEMKDRWEIFYSKVQFYGIMKKAMKPPKTLNGVEHAAAVFRALPLLFPSSTMPPRKLGANSEALFHVLTTSEDPDGFLHQRPLSCPVVVVSEDNCMIAIGSTPVATFDILIGRGRPTREPHDLILLNASVLPPCQSSEAKALTHERADLNSSCITAGAAQPWRQYPRFRRRDQALTASRVSTEHFPITGLHHYFPSNQTGHPPASICLLSALRSVSLDRASIPLPETAGSVCGKPSAASVSEISTTARAPEARAPDSGERGAIHPRYGLCGAALRPRALIKRITAAQ